MNSRYDPFSNTFALDELQKSMQRVGLTLAKVTNITDPKELNRVRCRPVAGESETDILETDWCPVVQPLSGKGCGQYFMPSVDDLVLLAYLNGDPHCPYVMGGVWNQDSAAPYTLKEGKNLNFSIRTPGGAELLFYDEKEKETITLKTPKGAQLKLDDAGQEATLQDPESKNSLRMNWKDGGITLHAEKKLILSAGDTTITLESSGALTVKAGGKIEVKGAEIEQTATNGFKAKGASANVEADGKLTLKGASADLKGSAGVNIN
ncbi:MAG: phage baseplate assembly protein V [Faecalibacterium sp.]